MDWKIHHMHLNTAYLNGILVVEIYIDKSKDFVHASKKNLYEFKKSSRAWYHCINLYVINKDFVVAKWVIYYILTK
jgi:hypothetical protein